MTSVVVFTAQIGDQTDDVRRPLVVDPEARYVCFSDRPCTVAPYEWIRVPRTANPRLMSRRIKILADHPIFDGVALTLWHDASYRLRRDLTWVRTALGRDPDLVALANPKRQRIELEAMRIAHYGYLPETDALAHVARYRADGFDQNILTCAGLLARRASEKMTAFNALWWHEAQQWGGRDQGSLNYAAWKTGLVVGHLKGNIKHNTFANWRPDVEAVPA